MKSNRSPPSPKTSTGPHHAARSHRGKFVAPYLRPLAFAGQSERGKQTILASPPFPSPVLQYYSVRGSVDGASSLNQPTANVQRGVQGISRHSHILKNVGMSAKAFSGARKLSRDWDLKNFRDQSREGTASAGLDSAPAPVCRRYAARATGAAEHPRSPGLENEPRGCTPCGWR